MFYIKKFFLLIGSFSIISSPIIYSQIKKQKEFLKHNALFDKNLQKVFKFFNKSSPNISIDSFFKDNLTTFSTNFHDSITENIIFKWFNKKLNFQSLSPEFFFKIDKILKQKDNNYLESNQTSEFHTWNTNNWNIKQTKESFKEIFINLIFKKFFLKHENGDFEEKTDTFKPENEKKLNEKIASFQKFLLNTWISEEKIFYLKETKFAHSDKDDDETYEDDIKNNDQFKFPNANSDQEYLNLIKKITSQQDVNDWNKDETLFSLNDLNHIEDKNLFTWLIYQYKNLNPTTITPRSSLQTKKTIKNPFELEIQKGLNPKYEQSYLHLFLDNFQENKKCQKINKTIFKFGNFSTNLLQVLDSKNQTYCLYKIREIKKQNNNEHQITFINGEKNLYFFQNDSTTALRKKILNQLTSNKENETKTKLLKYLKNNFNYLVSLYLSESNQKFFSDFHSNLKNEIELIKKTTQFLKTHNENKNFEKLKLKVFNSMKFNWEFEKNNEKFLLNKKYGLENLIFFKPNINKYDEITKINWKGASSDNQVIELPTEEGKKQIQKAAQEQQIITQVSDLKNDGTFDELFEKPQYLNLFIVAKELQKSIPEFTLKSQHANKLFNNYFLDATLNKMFHKQDFFKKYLTNKNIQSALGLTQNEIPELTNSLLEKLLILIKKYLPTITKEDIENNFEEFFYVNTYKKLSLSEKLSYGGFKVVDKEKQLIIKSKNYWFIKNYFFNDFGYEFTSDSISKKLNFLYFIWFLLNDNLKNLKNTINSVLPKNEFGYLVWKKELETTKALSNKEFTTTEVGKLLKINNDKIFKIEDNKFNLFEYPNYFKNVNNLIETEPAEIVDFSNSISAIHKKENTSTNTQNNKNFDGFLGLQTRKLFDEKTSLIDPKIFNQSKYFYFEEDEQKENIFEINSYPESGTDQDLVLLWDKFNNKTTLTTYIQNKMPEINQKLLEKLEKDKKLLSELTLKELKNKIKEIFNENVSFKKKFKRFSGNLKIETDLEQPTDLKSFLFSNNQDSKILNLYYVIQVNNYDFTKNFKNLTQTIEPKTILKSLYLLFFNEKILEKFNNENKNNFNF